jgi:hypothetical protein
MCTSQTVETIPARRQTPVASVLVRTESDLFKCPSGISSIATELSTSPHRKTHALFEVTLIGTAHRILGTDERRIVEGPSAKAQLSFPNGVACHPWVPKL